MSTTTTTTREECVEFLNREAELLDDRRLGEWLELLTEDVEYVAPRRLTVESGSGNEFSDRSFHFQEDWGSLRARVKRLETEYAWSEDPPSRTRRLVSNVRIGDPGDDADAASEGNEFPVRSNFLLYRTHGNSPDADVVAGEHRDTLRRVDGELRLARRRILLDTSILDMGSVSIFL